MEKASKFLPFILGGIVAIVVFFVSRKIRNGNTSTERAAILEKAREAKLAKSILKKSEDEESTSNFE
jgi:phosphate/sulfate permease